MKNCVLFLLGLIPIASPVAAGDWPQFRGPGGTGVSAEKGFPVRWSDKDNLRWKAVLHGRGQSSPVVAGGRVYLTACSGATQDRLHILCFDAGSSKRLWMREFWATGETISHPKTSMAAPTPVAAGGRLYALFASGDLFCLDRDGLLLWCRTLARDYPGVTNHIGMASSPVLCPSLDGAGATRSDVLVVVLETPEESFAAGIDARTGRNRWKVKRPPAATWTTPLVWTRAGRTEVVLQSGEKLSGHEAETGRERWSYTGKELAKIASPVAGRDLVLAATREELLAVRPGTDAARPAVLAWQSAKLRPSTATPLVYRDCVYSVSSAGVLTCGEAATGKELWRKRVTGPFSASPVVADGKLYLVGERGVTTVIQLGKTPEILASNDLGETLLASPAFAEGALFLRGDRHLFCIAQKRSARRSGD